MSGAIGPGDWVLCVDDRGGNARTFEGELIWSENTLVKNGVYQVTSVIEWQGTTFLVISSAEWLNRSLFSAIWKHWFIPERFRKLDEAGDEAERYARKINGKELVDAE